MELQYNYYRTFDPLTGRYLESDPIGLAAGLNTYAYVGNMPTMRVDPYGLYEVVGNATPAQRKLLEDLGEAFERGLVDFCEKDRAEMQEIFDNMTVSVDPRIGTVEGQIDRRHASADFSQQHITFRFRFFNRSSRRGQARTFAHEFRHLMRGNYDLRAPNEFNVRAFGTVDEINSLPTEIDANEFSRIYNADACACGFGSQ